MSDLESDEEQSARKKQSAARDKFLNRDASAPVNVPATYPLLTNRCPVPRRAPTAAMGQAPTENSMSQSSGATATSVSQSNDADDASTDSAQSDMEESAPATQVIHVLREKG